MNIIRIKDVYQQWGNKSRAGNMTFNEFTDAFSEEFTERPRSSEDRQAERTELPPIPAEVQPLDDNFEPLGKPFFAMVRNISTSGIGLMFGEQVSSKYLQLQIDRPSGGQLSTVVEVKHCTADGVMIGGNALTELRPG